MGKKIKYKDKLINWAKRREEIAKKRLDGWTLNAIASEYRISRQRVMQILARELEGE